MKTVSIYALVDPRDGCVRYIGKAADPEARYRKHLCPYYLRADTYKNKWIKSLLSQGLTPTLKIIEEVPEDQWERREQYWVAFYRGDMLTNGTPGGDGGPTFNGRHHTPETISRIRSKQKGRQFSDLHRQKISQAQIGRIRWSAVRRATEVNSREWCVVSPCGEEFRIKNLRQFCLKRGINCNHLREVGIGRRSHASGWVCVCVTDSTTDFEAIAYSLWDKVANILVSPSGETFYVVNLSEFSRRNSLSQSSLSAVLRGVRRHHKGWIKGYHDRSTSRGLQGGSEDTPGS